MSLSIVLIRRVRRCEILDITCRFSPRDAPYLLKGIYTAYSMYM